MHIKSLNHIVTQLFNNNHLRVRFQYAFKQCRDREESRRMLTKSVQECRETTNMLGINKTFVLIVLISCLSIGKCVESDYESSAEILEALLSVTDNQSNNIGTTATTATVISPSETKHSFRSIVSSTGLSARTSGGGFDPSKVFQHYDRVFQLDSRFQVHLNY